MGETRCYANTVPYIYLRYTYNDVGSICGFSLWNAGDTAWTEYYFATNLQGDVLQVYRATDNLLVADYTYDAWGNILSATSYTADNLANINPFRYRGYYYDTETGFYYLQSRYYDPEIGRFINADTYASTGQGVIGHNMFAYCLNNPVNQVDPVGTIPFADHFYSDAFAAMGKMIGDWLWDSFNKERETAKKLTYKIDDTNKNIEIIDSQIINNPIVMYEYIEDHRGDEVAGSTTGVVFEWVVHNIAYDTGELANGLGFNEMGSVLMKKGNTLDFGRTIYDDSHGFFSWVMWRSYEVLSPGTAFYDLCIKVFE